MNTEKQLERIVRMLGSDPGLFLLALHSFIEGFLKESFGGYISEDSFARNISYYRDWRKEEAGGFLKTWEWNLYSALKQEHIITNQVRHEFKKVSMPVAESGSYNFIRFCKICGIDSENLTRIEENLSIWENRTSHIEDYRALMDEKWAHFQDQRRLKEIIGSLKEYEEEKAESAHLARVLKEQEYELSRLNDTVTDQKERMEQIRKERGSYRLELERIRKSLGGKEDIKTYLEYLRRATYYTRTRMDYEQSIVRLTPEQKSVLERINIDRDFLIKGGAGTGKTLVLLEALKRAQKGEKETLGIEGKRSFLLLTYTSTLVKYNQYVSSIMGIEGVSTSIRTADSVLRDVLQWATPEWIIDYRILQVLLKSIEPPDFISLDELSLEIETMIYGNNLSEDEYINRMVPRTGMKNPLRKDQRSMVWNIKAGLEDRMFADGTLSQGLACRCILEFLDKEADPSIADYIFVDESQDLKPVQLTILKILARRSLILAGDTDQSIYGLGSPYKRAGVSVQGHAAVLRTNFRNSTPIHELAEAFRQETESGNYDMETEPAAFRAGPVPELFTAEKTAELYDRLIDKIRIFIRTLEYAPDNIAVIAPTRTMLAKIEKLLEKEGIPSSQIKENSFEFSTNGGVRLSPLPSSKGLDFPVVMCFLPFLPEEKGIDSASQQTLQKNRVYVAITRAMENLNIFCKESPEEMSLAALVRVYKATFTSQE